MPVVNSTSTMIASTSTGVAPWTRMSRTVNTASATMNSRATVKTAWRTAVVNTPDSAAGSTAGG